MAQYRRPLRTVQYVSQYDPARNQRINDDLARRDQEFKQSYSAMAQEKARQGDIFFVDNKAKEELAKNFNKAKQDILEKYDYKYDQAAPALANLVASERSNPLYALNKYQQKKLDEYNQLKIKFGDNLIANKKVPLSLHDTNGNIRSASDFDYDVEERDDYIKKIKEAGSGIARSIRDGGLKVSHDMSQFIEHPTTSGWGALSPKDKEAFYKSAGDILDNETSLLRDPKYGNKKDETPSLNGYNYVKTNAPYIFGTEIRNQYLQNKDYIPKKDRIPDVDIPSNIPGVLSEYGLVNNPKAITPDKLIDANTSLNISHSDQMYKGLTKGENYYNRYRSGEISLDTYQSEKIEEQIRNNNPEMNELYKIATETNKSLFKRAGLPTDTNIKDISNSNEQDEATILAYAQGKVEKGIKMVYDRNQAVKRYNKLLNEQIPKYIEQKGLNLDTKVGFYQPDLSQKGVSTKIAAFNKNIDLGYTKPGQFTFLDGDMKNKKSADEINNSYTKKTQPFRLMAVSGNELQPLIWKVQNPDGTVSNATWHTGYKKQLNYINNINYNKGLIEGLNASLLDTKPDGTLYMTMPDGPKEIPVAIKDYDLTLEPDVTSNVGGQYLKSKEGYIYLDDKGIIKTTTDKNKAVSYPKGFVVDIIKALGTKK